MNSTDESGAPPRVVSALSERYGEPKRVHTSVPPLRFGGGADVAEIPNPTGLSGTLYVTAGISELADDELVMCTHEPEPVAIEILSALGNRIAGGTRFDHGHTMALGDPDAPFAGVALAFR